MVDLAEAGFEAGFEADFCGTGFEVVAAPNFFGAGLALTATNLAVVDGRQR